MEKTNFFLSGVVDYTKLNTMDENHRIDFLFSELAPNIVACIEQIYEICFDEKPNAEVKAAMQAYLDDHKREKKDNQPRSLQEFHLTEDEVAFEEYSNMFFGDGI